MTSTSLSHDQKRGAGWLDLAAGLATGNADVVLIALGEDEASEKLRKVLENAFAEIDQVTGSSLLILAPVRPPEDWFLRKVELFKQLPSAVQELHRDELQWLRTPLGLQTARRSMANLIADQWDGAAVPSLVFLADAIDREGSPQETQAWSHDFGQFQTRDQVVSALAYLGTLAANRRAGTCSVEDQLNDEAYSWTNPTSLRWRSAKNRSLRAFDIARDWASRIKGIAR